MKAINPCIRCGKERVLVREWKETIENYFGNSTITHSEYDCPDAECQKIVTEKNDALVKKKEQLEKDKLKRNNNRMANAKKNAS